MRSTSPPDKQRGRKKQTNYVMKQMICSGIEQIYNRIVEQLNELYMRARANAAAFNDLFRRAPPGVDRWFSEAMPYPDFWLRLALPDWDDPRMTTRSASKNQTRSSSSPTLWSRRPRRSNETHPYVWARLVRS